MNSPSVAHHPAPATIGTSDIDDKVATGPISCTTLTTNHYRAHYLRCPDRNTSSNVLPKTNQKNSAQCLPQHLLHAHFTPSTQPLFHPWFLGHMKPAGIKVHCWYRDRLRSQDMAGRDHIDFRVVRAANLEDSLEVSMDAPDARATAL